MQRGEGGPPTALLARHTELGLEYAGGAAVTLAGREREEFWRAVESLASDRPALPMAKGTQAGWIRPEMVVRARYLKGAEKLRHATLCGLCALAHA